MPAHAHFGGDFPVVQPCRLKLGVQRFDPFAPSLNLLQLRPQVLAQLSQRIRLDPVLASEPANVEQPRLDRLQPRGIVGQNLRCALDLVLGIVRLDQRPVESRQRFSQERMLGRAALDPACGLP
jgi:hypothetical protein